MTRRTVTGRDPRTGQPIAVRIEGGRIAAIEPGPEPEDFWLSPGLIDLQVNGYAGHDLNAPDVTPETVISLSRAMRRVGVTTFLPTIVTTTEERIIAALRAIAEARTTPGVGNMIPFVHVEGPFVSPEDGARGAHQREFVRPSDLEEVQRWQAWSGRLVGMLTLSPHDEASLSLIRALYRSRVRVAIGHTHASADQIRAATRAGATLSTHLGNGAAAVLPRHPNFIWAQLAEDALTATFIADGHHLPADTFAAMLRAKGLSRSILVSDSVALGGQPPGIYDQPIGGRVELTADGRLSLAGTPYLAGAARPLKDCVANAIAMANISLADALMLATKNPGAVVDGSGVLRVGESANLIRFRWAPGDHSLAMETVLVAGQDSL